MIEWLRRIDPDLPFLIAGSRAWTYGETLEEAQPRLAATPRLIQPSLTPESVFDIIAGIASGGATVVGPEPETTEPGAADLVVFTSGTTGPPKGVRLTMQNLTAAAIASAQHLGHGPEDNWLLAMPLHHVGGLSILVRQAYTGGSITMLPEFDARTFADALHDDVTMASVVPTMLAQLVDFGPFEGLSAVLVGGGPIHEGILETASDAGLPVLPTYGMTETFGQIATLRPDAPLAHLAHPLPGIEIRIEADGRIAVKGDQVSSGYLGRPDRPDPWFVTSDLGEIDEDGALRVLGRTDEMIVTGGENVDPARVESALSVHPDVSESLVVGVPDDHWGTAVACLYVGGVDADDLASWARDRISAFMVPKKWRRVEAIPRTSMGKPDRSAGAELF